MRSNQVISSAGTVDIHPYVQGRLRTLPRQDESGGILLGNSENGVTHVTGFRRAPPKALRQAAVAAGPRLVGFYRLQTPGSTSLKPEEEELWREAQPYGRGVFLVVHTGDGPAAQATVWIREGDEEPVAETVSLDHVASAPQPDPPAPALTPIPIPQVSIPIREVPPEPSRIPWRVLCFSAILLMGAAGAFRYWPVKAVKAAPGLSLDLQSRAGELVASWEQEGPAQEPPQSATLTIRDGGSEQALDLTPNYVPKGRIVLKPKSRDIVVTLNVQFAGVAPLTRAVTYIGFNRSSPEAAPPAKSLPPPAEASAAVVPPRQNNNRKRQEAAAAESSELAALRKRNKELENAVAALRKFVPH